MFVRVQALCLTTRQVVAVKVVQLVDSDEPTLDGYRNEIGILRRLQWSPRIIKLHDWSVNYLFIIMMYRIGGC